MMPAQKENSPLKSVKKCQNFPCDENGTPVLKKSPEKSPRKSPKKSPKKSPVKTQSSPLKMRIMEAVENKTESALENAMTVTLPDTMLACRKDTRYDVDDISDILDVS